MNKHSRSGSLETNGKRRDQSFVQGTVILTGSLLLVKLMGILFRIFVTGMIGPTGATYFTVAYEIYNPLFALATAGLPIAISRMVSENVANGRYRDVKKIKKICTPIFLLTGTVGLILMTIGAFVVPNLPFVHVPGAFYSVLALAPTIFFACLMSIYRGYYQGLKNMTPTATSEVIEACCKFFIGYVTSYSIIHFGMSEYAARGTFLGRAYATRELAEAAIMPLASAGAILGISLGAAAGFLYLVLRDKLRGDGITKEEISASPQARGGMLIAKTLIKSALPIGLGAIIMNLAGLIDTTLILHRIQCIMLTSPGELLAQYGDKIGETVIKGKDGVLLVHAAADDAGSGDNTGFWNSRVALGDQSMDVTGRQKVKKGHGNSNKNDYDGDYPRRNRPCSHRAGAFERDLCKPPQRCEHRGGDNPGIRRSNDIYSRQHSHLQHAAGCRTG